MFFFLPRFFVQVITEMYIFVDWSKGNLGSLSFCVFSSLSLSLSLFSWAVQWNFAVVRICVKLRLVVDKHDSSGEINYVRRSFSFCYCDLFFGTFLLLVARPAQHYCAFAKMANTRAGTRENGNSPQSPATCLGRCPKMEGYCWNIRRQN